LAVRPSFSLFGDVAHRRIVGCPEIFNPDSRTAARLEADGPGFCWRCAPHRGSVRSCAFLALARCGRTSSDIGARSCRLSFGFLPPWDPRRRGRRRADVGSRVGAAGRMRRDWATAVDENSRSIRRSVRRRRLMGVAGAGGHASHLVPHDRIQQRGPRLYRVRKAEKRLFKLAVACLRSPVCVKKSDVPAGAQDVDIDHCHRI